jgi:tetratricopeptide (TPR) repeat protein
MLEHGIIHLEFLLRNNQNQKAFEVYSQCLLKDPAFSPPPLILFRLGKWMVEDGKIKEAIGAYNQIVKVYPNDPLVPKAYFRAAQIFHNRLLNPSRSKKILNSLIKKYPNHEIIPQVKAYLGHL